ncbi:hypothetical protein [Accumulibacter sp.]|jgi:hypothetical protein|uniref:Uncharacterized protein n=1 Tax=Accumulibacter regalis TaxID=522306 RepID=C7RQP2_ACCRE|nr:hypothetical protein [Accumulibacter sp.]MBN8497307.1 hypothetical protein [Accumulibacter sp.]MBO3714367.1 hypothetical protein [Accumulibacter sp.]
MRTFSDFFAYLGCPLRNTRWSWSAVSADGRRALFTLWSDEVKNRQYVLYPTSLRRPREIPEEADSRLGAEEIARNAHYAASTPGVEAFGVLTIAKDTNATTRERATYDDSTVFRLRIEVVDGVYIAHLVERPSVRSLVEANSAG